VATALWRDAAVLFSTHHFPLSGAPDWHGHPFRPGVHADCTSHWSRIPDFDPSLGDIKAIWEASRFEWLVAMAQRASLGDNAELERLNSWLADWIEANPPFFGTNWKCGQEASIRVMHLALAALILGETGAPSRALMALVGLHLARIARTMDYAIGQQNNHGTSQAAALFIGGNWLAMLGEPAGAAWARRGRYWLEDRAKELIEPDGTFSQYSVNYHRVVLDTYSLVEAWRRHLQLPAFSDRLVARLQAATLWLQQMTEPQTGDAPNIGANDGARLIPLTDTNYRDFRPSLQLAANLFCGARAIASEGSWDQPAAWLDLVPPDTVLPPPSSRSLDHGGFHVLRRGRAVAYLRYPRFRFRPSQADALHLDFWLGEENLLPDAGTYSYSESGGDFLYFSGTAAHNTVQLDGRDQMPRLSRFLFGSWLRAEGVTPVSVEKHEVRASAGYRDAKGATHHRAVELRDSELICLDRLAGKATRAVLRWRLQSCSDWRMEDCGVTNGAVRLSVTSDRPILRTEIVEGFESRAYLSKAPLPVLEVECHVPASLRTEIRF
jgi:hypothetical protein